MPQKRGVVLCLAIALAFSACRNDKPPSLSIICIGDGFGGADCVTSAGERIYKKPSELRTFWMTSQNDMQNFASWCYDTDKKEVRPYMSDILATAYGIKSSDR